MNKQERREFIRVPFRTSLAVRTQDRTIWSTNSLDISMTGLRASTQAAPPEEGTTCEVEIVLSEAEPPVIIEARGAIVRSAPGTIAVHFTEIDLDSFGHLRQVVLNNTGDPDQAEEELRSHWGIRKPPA
jgi:hypothetical protein